MTEPFSFSAEQLDLISGLIPPDGSDAWSLDGAREIRALVKTRCIDSQSSKCCYCDRFLATQNHRMWDVDHVVPRSTHPQFAFESLNLVACCPDCNIAKGNTQTLANRRRVTYPDVAAGFTLVHPHFDTYSDHIFHTELIYIPKTIKGKKTIYVCDLLRYAQKYIDWPTSISDDRYESDVDAVVAGGPGSIAVLGNLIAGLPVAGSGMASGSTD